MYGKLNIAGLIMPDNAYIQLQLVLYLWLIYWEHHNKLLRTEIIRVAKLSELLLCDQKYFTNKVRLFTVHPKGSNPSLDQAMVGALQHWVAKIVIQHETIKKNVKLQPLQQGLIVAFLVLLMANWLWFNWYRLLCLCREAHWSYPLVTKTQGWMNPLCLCSETVCLTKAVLGFWPDHQ